MLEDLGRYVLSGDNFYHFVMKKKLQCSFTVSLEFEGFCKFDILSNFDFVNKLWFSSTPSINFNHSSLKETKTEGP